MSLLKTTFKVEAGNSTAIPGKQQSQDVCHIVQKFISDFLRNNSEVLVKVNLQETFQNVRASYEDTSGNIRIEIGSYEEKI